MASHSLHRRRGFTLLEIVLGLAVAVPLFYGATLLALAIVKASVDERVTALFVSPADRGRNSLLVYRGASAAVEADAVAYHAVLSSKLSKATATYVFGAENIAPLASRVSATSSVQIGALATDDWVDLAVANTQRTAREFLESYGSALGVELPAASSDNFSLVVVGPLPSGELHITAIAQVMCLPADILSKGETLPKGTLQWARLWTAEGYAEYAWVLSSQQEGAQPWKPRASQYWLRLDDSLGLYEPGLAVCRFPDPIPPVDTETSGEAGIARFVYVL